MKIILRDNTEITVRKSEEGNRYIVNPIEYQFDLDYYLNDVPIVIAGCYVPEKIGWFEIKEIFKSKICPREVKDVILEKGEFIIDIPFEKGVIY